MQKKNFSILVHAMTFATTFAWAIPETKSTPIAPKQVPLPAQKSEQIKIKAHINPSELGYKKFFSTYYPETFKVRANGKEIYSIKNKDVLLQDKEITIPVTGNKVTIEYEYEWDMITGKRTCTKQVEFDLNDKVKNLELKFGSWKEENRIVIPQASQVGEEKKIK